MKLHELKEKKSGVVLEMRGLVEAAETANRDMSAEEKTRFDELKVEERALADRIERASYADEMERRSDVRHVHGAGAGNGEAREMRNYSLAKAIQESSAGRLTGLEAEVHADLSRGREVRGVMVPTNVILERRAVTTTTPADGPGGNLIGRDVRGYTEHPRPLLKVEAMGATVLRDLEGNVILPRLTESGTANWVAEHTNVTRSDPKFGKAELSPKTVGAEYEVSRRMILQTSSAIEDILRRDLSHLLRGALDKAAIAGTGGTQPLGVLNTPGIIEAAPTSVLSDLTAEMMASLDLDDFDGTRAFLTNPAVLKLARTTKDGDGRLFTLAELFHSERVEWSTQVPGDYGDDEDANALIYGQWNELIIGYWSGVDILANPFHADVASKGGLLLHAFLDADVVVREPKAFVVAAIDEA